MNNYILKKVIGGLLMIPAGFLLHNELIIGSLFVIPGSVLIVWDEFRKPDVTRTGKDVRKAGDKK